MSKDGWFAENLIAASHATSLVEAAAQWEFSHEGMVAHGARGNCQLCHTPFAACVVIKNDTSQIRLEIGSGCYKKLVQFRALHRLESARMRPLDEYRRELREYARRHALENAVLPWMRAQKSLPDAIKEIIATFDRLGFPASMNDAELLVSYYRMSRFFPLKTTRLIDPETRQLLERFPHRELLPKRINLTGMARLIGILAKWHTNEEDKRMREERVLFHERLAKIFRGAPDGIVPFRVTYTHPSLSIEVEFVHKNDRLVFTAVIWDNDPLREYLVPGIEYSSGVNASGFGVLEIEVIIQHARPEKIRFVVEKISGKETRVIVSKNDAAPWSVRARTQAQAILRARMSDLAVVVEENETLLAGGSAQK